MGPEGSSLPDEPGALGSPGQDDPGLAMREPFLRQVLAEFEAGELEAYDYARRAFAINAATSIAQMQAVVGQSFHARPAGGRPAGPPGFDAVDLARLQAAQRSENRRPTARYLTLAVVFVL